MKKKMLVLSPIMPSQNDLIQLEKSLFFLKKAYQITLIDSLAYIDEVKPKDYYLHFSNILNSKMDDFDVFCGFSFGGVILQQHFPLFEKNAKSIVLFSTPSHVDGSLKNKLNQIISYCQNANVDKALSFLYQWVFYPKKPPAEILTTIDSSITAKRFIYGLKLIIITDSRKLLQTSKIPFLHLIGKNSQLVGSDNVLLNSQQHCLVPDAGMRMLEDNFAFCVKKLSEYLRYDL